MKQYQAEALMYKTELNEVKEINGRRKEREGGKHHVLKNTPVASSERVEKALREAKEVTNRKKKGKRKGKRNHNRRWVVSNMDDIDSSMDDTSDVEEPLDLKMFDCIEVA